MSAHFKDEPVSQALPIPFSVKKDELNSGIIHVLVRPEATRLRNAVAAQFQKDTFDKCVLTGPSGAGKSLLLYLCAMDCLISEKWLTLYIANIAQFNGQDDDECARIVLGILIDSNAHVFLAANHAKFPVLYQIKCLAEKAIREEVGAKGALQKIQRELFRKVEIPVFVGIDHWNCLQATSPDGQDMLINLFGHFSKFDFRRGYAMLEFSSSFNVQKSAMFQDGDGGKATVQIPLYTDEEWHLIVNYYREHGVFPSVDQLGDDKLRDLTGRVPRLLATVKQRYVEKGHNWAETDYMQLKKSNRDYFAARVKAVMARNKTEKDILEFSCRVCINHLQSVRRVPSIWIDSGLFENGEDGQVIPIAPDVIGAMHDTISTNN